MISVLIPTRNRPGYLEQAVRSACEQRGEVEVIVEEDPQATGQSATVNRALARARGEFVTVLHDDDYYVRPDALALLLDTLEGDWRATAAYSLPEYVDAQGVSRGTPENLTAWQAAHRLVTWASVADGLVLHGGGILYRRDTWETAGAWDETLPCCEEWEYHLRLLSQGGVFVACPVVTVAYRQHRDQKSALRGPTRYARRSAARLEVRKTIRARYANVTPPAPEPEPDADYPLLPTWFGPEY
jgi:glycosyltransferase involved in cell wall biosynthesis